MNILKNWKTTLVGLAAGALMLAGSAYQPGMTWKQWGAAAGVAVLGILAKDA